MILGGLCGRFAGLFGRGVGVGDGGLDRGRLERALRESWRVGGRCDTKAESLDLP